MRPIQQIAKESRAWADSVAETLGHDDNLAGMCAIASTHLMIRLHKEGYADARVRKVIINGNRGHCFVEVNEWIVDITATQFSREDDIPSVLMFRTSVRDTPPACVEHVYMFYSENEGQLYRSQRGLIVSQRKERWGDNEMAYVSHLRDIPIPIVT